MGPCDEHGQHVSALASPLPDADSQLAQMQSRLSLLGYAAAQALIWIAASALAVLASHASLTAAALPASIALGVTMLGFRWPPSRLLAAAFALIAAALEPATVLPWTVAAICLSTLFDQRASAVCEPDLGELDRCLERCRRRGEPASILFLEIEPNAEALRNLLQTVRIAESFVVRRSSPRFEVYGLLEQCDLARPRVEARFAEALNGVTAAFGWASYPVDGLTLDVLLEHARSSTVSEPAPSERVHSEPSRVGAHSETVVAHTFDPASEGARS